MGVTYAEIQICLDELIGKCFGILTSVWERFEHFILAIKEKKQTLK